MFVFVFVSLFAVPTGDTFPVVDDILREDFVSVLVLPLVEVHLVYVIHHLRLVRVELLVHERQVPSLKVVVSLPCLSFHCFV